MALNPRQQEILRSVVELHIETAEPVSSQAVARGLEARLSPATVRNVMAELEEQGYLASPHTSAGRIPTELGYQNYVDDLLRRQLQAGASPPDMAQPVPLQGLGMEEALQRVSRALSETSRYAGMVLTPQFSGTVFRHIEFLLLPEKRILVILVSEAGIVEHRLIAMHERVGQRDLEQAAAYLNRTLSGLTMGEAQLRILEQMAEEKAQADDLMRRALYLSREALREELTGQVYIEGTSRVLDQPEFADLERMKALLRAFEQKSLMVSLLDRSRRSAGVQVQIGAQTGIPEIRGCSLITASFTGGRGATGTLGVFGPTRMPYAQVIPLVMSTARRVSQLFAPAGNKESSS